MKAPAFQLYVADFLVGTAHMTPHEVGVYIRLLCHQWDRGELPDDQEKCARLAGLPTGTTEIPAEVWLKFGCVSAEAGVRVRKNARLASIQQQQREYREMQSAKGRLRHGTSQTPAKRQPNPAEPQPNPAEPQPNPAEPQPNPAEPQPNPAEPQPNASLRVREAAQPKASTPISDLQPPVVPLSSPKGTKEASASPSSAPAPASSEKKEGRPGGDRAERLARIDLALVFGKKICALFGRKSDPTSAMLANLAEHAKCGVLQNFDPLQWASIVRMHAHLEKNEPGEDFTLKSGWLKSAEALAEHLPKAGDIALRWVRENLGGSADAGTAKKIRASEGPPEDWPARYAKKFNEPPACPWEALPPGVQAELKGAA